MRQVHKAGEKTFVDYAGQRPPLVDTTTGEVVPVELFVAVLGASNYTFAEATLTQHSADFIRSHTRTRSSTSAASPRSSCRTNCGPASAIPCRYEPGVQRTYADWARHYGTVIVPARPAKPRDKAKVEVGVQVAERWILARLRHEIFFTLAALNERIASCSTELNARPMKGLRRRTRGATSSSGSIARRCSRCRRDRFVYADWRQGPRQHRLSRRGRSPLLLGPASADSRRRSTSA